MKTKSIDVNVLNDAMKKKEKCLLENDDRSFYKILLKDLNDKNTRRIPKDFQKIMGLTFPWFICLMSPWGQKWRVLVDLEGEDMVMIEGWKDFLNENEIKEEQLLVFRHVGENNFNVQIFNPSGLEKICETKKVQRSEEASSFSSSSTNGKRKRGRPLKNAQTGSINCSPGEEAERKLSTNIIPAFFKPFVAPDRLQRLKMPFSFSTYMQGRMPGSAFLRDRNGNRWLVTIAFRDHVFCFEGGWAKFVEKNNVQYGDFLVFQYDGKFNFDFRALGLSACEKSVMVRAPCVEIKEKDIKEEEVESQKNEEVVGVNGYVVEEGDEDFREEEEEDDDDDDDDDDDEYVVSDDDNAVDDDDDDECVAVDQDDDNPSDDNLDVESSDSDNEEPKRNRGSAAAGMVPYGRRSYNYVLGEENKIFESGKVERPRVNAYFVAKINPFRTSDLYIPIEVIKDFNLKLQDSIIIRDEVGRVWTVKVTVWKDGRTWLAKGWKAFCRWNKVKQGDLCLCEFVPQDGENYILQIKVVRL